MYAMRRLEGRGFLSPIMNLALGACDQGEGTSGATMPITWRDVSTNPDIRDKIFLICDIDTSPDDGVPDWITVDGGADAFAVLRDGTGGLFLITPASPRIIYASSEGEAGIIADDLESLM